MKEAQRYLHNARVILKKAPRKGRTYTDIKPVREACGTAYLSVLEAIDGYLLKRGFTEKELPKSVDEYRKALRKYIAIHDGKLFREFDSLYHALHIAGYYRKDISDIAALRELFNTAQQFIYKISG